MPMRARARALSSVVVAAARDTARPAPIASSLRARHTVPPPIFLPPRLTALSPPFVVVAASMVVAPARTARATRIMF